MLERFKARADAERRSKASADPNATDRWMELAANKAAAAAALPDSMGVDFLSLQAGMHKVAKGADPNAVARDLLHRRI